MTGPQEERTTGEGGARTASAPGRLGRWWAKVPPTLGPARTSTVILIVLFVALGMLWLYVRPEATGGLRGGGGDTDVEQPAETTPSEEPTTTPPTTTTPAPTPSTPTTDEPVTPEEPPGTDDGTTGDDGGTGGGTGGGTDGDDAPTPTEAPPDGTGTDPAG